MIRVGVLAILLATAGLSACGDGGGNAKGQSAGNSSTKSGPARTEGKIETAQLQEFSTFLPAEVNGWKKQERLGFVTMDSQSTATATYRTDAGGAALTIVIIFSNNMVGQTQSLISNAKQAAEWGFEVTEFDGYPALSGKAGTGMAGTPFVVVLSNSRMVQLMYDPASSVTLETARAVFEKVDFKGIAEK